MKTNRKAFTLIELLVVIAIIAILAAILFPVFARVRAKAQQTQCLSNLKQLAMAVRMYSSDYDSNLPGYPLPGNNNWWADPSTGLAAYVSNKTNWSYTKVNPVWFCPSQEGGGGGRVGALWPDMVWEGIVANASENYWQSWMGWIGKPMNRIRSASECVLWADGIGNNGLGFSWAPTRSEDNNVYLSTWFAAVNPMTGTPVGTCPAPALAGLTAEPPYWPANANGYPGSARSGGIYVARHNGQINASFVDGHAKSMKLENFIEIAPITNRLSGGTTQNYVYRYLHTN